MILEVETDKATQEVEAPTGGILAKIIKTAGEEVPCNHVIAVITAEGEALPDKIPVEIAEGVAPTSELQAATSGQATPVIEEAPPAASQKRLNISPSARALAQTLGVDINKIAPKGDRIQREDVEAAYEAMKSKTAEPPRGAGEASVVRKTMSTLRRKTAEHMNQSARSVARVGLTLEVDATRLVAKRESTWVGGAKVSYNVLLAKQVASALKAFPYMNAQIRGDEIWKFEEVNIGVAVDTERGLLVPVLRAAADKSIETLQGEFLAMTKRAGLGKSTVEDQEGGTFTLTNLGSLDIESFLPIINVPECAILGVGAILTKPVVVDGQIVARSRMTLTLAFDHRLVDGAPAARFLQRLKTLIEQMPD
jgi:pyruvate dehydrogenase E2 component (dihydrolipoamide acetyltransferase)